jgi:DNA-binding NarL/FixJ family response regulator
MAVADTETAIRILIVDDHAVVRRGLLAFLDAEPDLEVVGDAADGEQALELLSGLHSKDLRPDVVLMDIQMVPIDGIEATRRIRALYDDVEVVALTSFGDEELVRAAFEAGAAGYLLKDADADDVAHAIRAAHRGDVEIDPAVARLLTASLRASRDHAAASALTARELDVLRLIARGEPNKAIAAKLGITERTARSHVSKILAKLQLTSRTQAALWAAREGFADLGSRDSNQPL